MLAGSPETGLDEYPVPRRAHSLPEFGQFPQFGRNDVFHLWAGRIRRATFDKL